MNRRINEILIQLKDSRSTLMLVVEPLSQNVFDRKVKEDQWSVGEILHHLYITEMGVLKILIKQVQRARQRKISPETSEDSVLHTLDQYNLTKVITKIKAPKGAIPEEGKKKKDLLELLGSSRSAILENLTEASEFDLSQLFFPHPMMGKINMYQWTIFIDQHERRHTDQLKTLLT